MERTKRDFDEIPIVTAHDADRAHAGALKAKVDFDNAENDLKAIVARQRQTTRRVRRYQLTRRARELCDNWTTREGGLFITVFAPCLVAVAVCHALGLPFFLWALLFLLVFISACFAGTQLFTPGDAALTAKIDSLHVELAALFDQKIQAKAKVTAAKQLFDRELSHYQQINNQFHTRLNRLRSTNWQALQGIPFEEFLAEVFREWGYTVISTKTGADQGIDLVVSKDKQKTAIQVQGYHNASIESAAIEEACAGKTIYGCQRCAVITNSTVTPSARRAARERDCLLIDQVQIPLLIEGKLSV